MSRARAAAAVATVTGLLLSGATASAAPRLCRLMVDPAGDGTAFAGTPSRDSLDIVSGDIATGSRNLVAALRLKSFAADPSLAAGATYTVEFAVGKVEHELVLRVYATGEREAFLVVDGIRQVPVTAVVDPTTSTITWTAKRALVPVLVRRGVKMSLAATSAASTNVQVDGWGTRWSPVAADSARVEGRTYVDGTPTCLRGV